MAFISDSDITSLTGSTGEEIQTAMDRIASAAEQITSSQSLLWTLRDLRNHGCNIIFPLSAPVGNGDTFETSGDIQIGVPPGLETLFIFRAEVYATTSNTGGKVQLFKRHTKADSDALPVTNVLTISAQDTSYFFAPFLVPLVAEEVIEVRVDTSSGSQDFTELNVNLWAVHQLMRSKMVAPP